MLSVTLTRQESFDPLRVIERATQQAVAEQIAREHADPKDPNALTFRYEKDGNSEGDYVDLVISGTDEWRVGVLLKRLRAHGYGDVAYEWASDEDPPHMLEVLSKKSGDGAPPARAREALGYHVPLVRDRSCAGLYKTLIPETFPAERDVTLGESEWTVRVIWKAKSPLSNPIAEVIQKSGYAPRVKTAAAVAQVESPSNRQERHDKKSAKTPNVTPR